MIDATLDECVRSDANIPEWVLTQSGSKITCAPIKAKERLEFPEGIGHQPRLATKMNVRVHTPNRLLKYPKIIESPRRVVAINPTGLPWLWFTHG